jgi:hypothetical protein
MKLYTRYITEATENKIVIALGKDWHGVYVKGKLRYQGYLENIDKFITALEVSGFLEKDSVVFKDVDSKWLFKKTELPDDLSDIKWEINNQEYRKSRIVNQKRDTRLQVQLGQNKKYGNKVKMK